MKESRVHIIQRFYGGVSGVVDGSYTCFDDGKYMCFVLVQKFHGRVVGLCS